MCGCQWQCVYYMCVMLLSNPRCSANCQAAVRDPVSCLQLVSRGREPDWCWGVCCCWYFLVKTTNVKPYRKYATSPVATCLSTYDAGRLATMMEVNCWQLTASERDSPALIPSYIALTEPTPSGRAQVRVKNMPSTSNDAHSMMERSLV